MYLAKNLSMTFHFTQYVLLALGDHSQDPVQKTSPLRPRWLTQKCMAHRIAEDDVNCAGDGAVSVELATAL
ncbi:hypothetical protein Tsubulata_032302 [Turnera subulata]|uniref:Uncharacterized protein n=1 Tax=Turnera subulata TaxID=218843 RepID=A0A9Q0FUP1_9ROSI|nr:hypothetical protein Tsubulata_032302 [Turnera subulata]